MKSFSFMHARALVSAPICLIVYSIGQPAFAEDRYPTGYSIEYTTTTSTKRSQVESGSSVKRQISISIPHTITQKSREMILLSAPDDIRTLILTHENQIDQLNALATLTPKQMQRRDRLMAMRFRLMRSVVMNKPKLRHSIHLMASGQRYRQGLKLSKQLMKNPEMYNKILKNVEPEMAIIIRRNTNSLRTISNQIRAESERDPKLCNANKLDHLYKKMSRLIDNQIGVLEKSGVVKTKLEIE